MCASPSAARTAMAKRLFHLCLAALGRVLTAPLLGIAALGIRLASPGPVFYRARRVGKDGKLFTMYKLRTMHLDPVLSPLRITGPADTQVFRFGPCIRCDTPYWTPHTTLYTAAR